MKGIFVRTPELSYNAHYVERMAQKLNDFGMELVFYDLDYNNIDAYVNFLQDQRPFFVIDVNGSALVYGESEGNRVSLCDAFGFLHISVFTEDPMLYYPVLLNGRGARNFIQMITDMKHADFLRTLGYQNVYFLAPFVSDDLLQRPIPNEKQIKLLFPGPIVDPNIIIQESAKVFPEEVMPVFVEVGEFMRRNPEVDAIFAVEYMLTFFNYDIQEKFLKWRNESPEAYISFLVNVGLYNTARKRLFVISFLEGIDIKILGDAQVPLKEGQEVITAQSQEDVLDIYANSMLTFLSFPSIVPSGIGFTPIEVISQNSCAFIDYRASLPGFFIPDQEIVAYTPLDRLEIEEKLLFFLDNEDQAMEIASNGRSKVAQSFTQNERAKFIADIINQIHQQSLEMLSQNTTDTLQ
jgi:glycosyltransferase involved in cell wall biosynthesis